jgi:hypothetical protein
MPVLGRAQFPCFEAGYIQGSLYPAADHLFQETLQNYRQALTTVRHFKHLTFWQETCCSQWKMLSLLEAQNGSTQPQGLARTLYCRGE